VIQSHILLALPGSKAIPAAMNGDLNTNGKYRDGITVSPQTFEGTATMRLSSILGVKESDVQGQWNHFRDVQQIPLNVRIVQSSCLYLQLQVSEYPSAVMLRALSVDVSATWLEDQNGKRLMQELREAEKRADAAEANAAAEAAARKTAEAQQAADDQAKEQAQANERAAEAQLAVDEKAKKEAEKDANKASSERHTADAHAEKEGAARKTAEGNAEKARLAEEDAKHNYEVEHKERVEAEEEAKKEKHELEEAKHKLHDKKIADKKAQDKIKKALENLPKERQCPAGYAWVQERGGYRCKGGHHHITWEELHAEHAAAKKIADDEAQAKIEEALKHLPTERHCPNGYAWVHERGGYRCTGGQHHITYEELNAERAAAKKVADEKAQEQIKHALKNLPEERHCPNGYAWVEEHGGYRCEHGGHHVTWEELRATHAAPKKIADAHEQEKIKKALQHLPKERHCPAGYAWVQESGGYRCEGGHHHITLEELHAVHAAPKKIADAHEQEKIKKALQNLPKERHCPAGYAWVQESGGYRCEGGHHHITLEELHAAEHVATKKVAGEMEQIKIKKALLHLPEERHCPNGYAWVQEHGGYRCTGGQHHITWEELNAEHAAAKKVADEKEQAKIQKALKNLPKARQCPNGYAWVQEHGGYRCERGGHHISWEELNVA